MNFQKLTIKNLASIEEAVIDFGHGPLAEESLFLICGETGAGKTTLLDAICLALYADTPRMDRAENERYKDLGGIFYNESKEIAVNDNRQLMRRNTAEAWAELEFIGSNEIPYTARWYVARARKKASGTLQPEKWTLENRRTHQQLTRRNEIKAEIQAAVGLTFEQFCRTTLLAQGDFTKFLQSKESEKSDILEKLTGTGIYSEIGATIFALTREKRQAYEQQARKTEGIRLLTEEETEAANAAIAAGKNGIEAQLRLREEAVQKREWLKREAELLADLDTRQKVWEERQKLMQSDEFRRQQEWLEEWDRTGEARNRLAIVQRLRQQQENNRREAGHLAQTFLRLSKGYRWLQAHRQQLWQQLQQTEAELQADAPLRPMLEQSQTIVATLEQMLAAQRNRNTCLQQAEALARQQPAHEEACREKEALLQARTEENRRKQEEADRMAQRHEALKPHELQTRKAALEKQRDELADARNALVLCEERSRSLQTARQKEKEIEAQWNIRRSKTEALQAEQAARQKAWKEIQALHDKQKEALADWAKEARAHLAEGDVCPVCGQTVRTLQQDEHFRSLLAPVRQEMERKEQAYKEAEQAFNANQAECAAYTRLLGNQRADMRNAERLYGQAHTEAAQKCAACGLPPLDESTEREIAGLQEANRQALDMLDAKFRELQEVAGQMARLQREKNRCQQEVDNARRSREEAEKRLLALKNEIAHRQALAEKEKENGEKTRERLVPLIRWQGWEAAWNESPARFMERLKQATARYLAAQTRQQQLTADISLADKELDGISDARKSICTAFPAWSEPTVTEAEEIVHTGREWNALNAQAEGLQRSIRTTESELEEHLVRLADFYKEHPALNEARLSELSAYPAARIEAMRTRMQQLREEAIESQSALRHADGQLQAHRSHRPAFKEEENRESLEENIRLADERITAANQEIGLQKARLAENERNIRLVKDEKLRTDALREVYLKWDRLCRHFGDEKGKNFRNIAQSFVLKELLAGANHYLCRLTDRYTLECQAGSLTILIRDLYQGGGTRPACTLSGGESFLVSLALALGLSSLSRQSLSVDVLFIDEGFGTLSSDYLNTVMDTLEKLHRMGGKKVGIISHVEGLRERIRTQIQVRRVDNSRSEIRVTS